MKKTIITFLIIVLVIARGFSMGIEEEKSGVVNSQTVFTLPVIFLSVIVGVIIITLIFVIRMINSNRVLETEPNNQASESWESNSNGQYIKDIVQRLSLLEEQVSKMQVVLETKDDLLIPKPNPGPNHDKSDPEEVFYLSTPNIDGSFDNNDASPTYRDGASIYRFIKVSLIRAKFYIENKDDSIQRALQYPDKRIDPVCEAENAFNPRSKSIMTVTPGEVELIGDKWVISYNRKAKIRYE